MLTTSLELKVEYAYQWKPQKASNNHDYNTLEEHNNKTPRLLLLLLLYSYWYLLVRLLLVLLERSVLRYDIYPLVSTAFAFVKQLCIDY